MTFSEINDYLWRTAFSEESLKGIENIYSRNGPKYLKELRRWWKSKEKDKYRIFKPVYYKGKNDERCTIIFYSDKPDRVYCVCFLSFWYKGRKYLASRPTAFNTGHDKGRIIFFSYHSFKRYSERFLGDPDSILDDEFLGDIFIYNTNYIEKEYTYQGKTSVALISPDGIWLMEYIDGCPVVKTFISEKEYLGSQKDIDKEAIEFLKFYRREIWDDTLEDR